MITDELKNYANKLKNYDIQIAVLNNTAYIVNFKNNKIASVIPKETTNAGVRVYDKKGRLSFLRTNIAPSIDGLLKVTKMTKMGFKDEHYKCLPKGGKYKKVKGLFDKKIEDIMKNDNVEYVADSAQKAINSALDYNSKIKKVHGYLTYEILKEYVFNSNGVECNDEKTLCGIELEIESIDGDKTGFGGGEQYQRNISDFDIKGITEETAGLAHDLLGAKRANLGDVPVILTSSSFRDMVIGSIRSMAKGEEIITGNSYLANKLGSKIGGKNLTIIDDPHAEAGEKSMSFDSEGVPTKKRAIIKKGVLKTYLLDWYTAQRMGMDAYGFNTKFMLRNIQVKQTSSLDEMLDLKEYVVLDYFYEGANVSTAEINGMSTGMRYYKNGKFTPLKQINVASKLANIMNNIIDISEPDPLVGRGNKIPKGVLVKKGIIKFS